VLAEGEELGRRACWKRGDGAAHSQEETSWGGELAEEKSWVKAVLLPFGKRDKEEGFV
jgi:hypothetical protein